MVKKSLKIKSIKRNKQMRRKTLKTIKGGYQAPNYVPFGIDKQIPYNTGIGNDPISPMNIMSERFSTFFGGNRKRKLKKQRGGNLMWGPFGFASTSSALTQNGAVYNASAINGVQNSNPVNVGNLTTTYLV